MKKLVLVLVLLVLLVSCQEKDVLTFVFTPGPGTDLALMEELYGGLVAEIGKAVGQDTEIIVTTSAAATTEALRNGTADIGRYGPFGYVMAVDEVGIVPLVRERMNEKGENYYGLIIAQPGLFTEPFDISQLKGRTVAFVESGSTSGYLFGITLMKEAGMTLDDLGAYNYAGSHPAVIEAVLNGAVEVGFTCDRRLDIAIAEGVAVEGENFVYLLQSPPIMLNPWAARPDIDVDIDELINAFLDLSDEVLAPGDVETMVVALDSDYDFVRDMALNQ